MKKRLLAGLLALTLLFSLAGCSGSTDTDTTEAEETEEAVEAEEEEEDDTEEEVDSEDSGEVITVTAVTAGTVKPYTYVGDDNELTGYDIEVLKEVFERLDGYELEIEIADFSAIFAGLNSGVYQIAVNNFSYSEERAESYLFSYPYDKISYVFYTREGEDTISSFEEAAGLTYEGSAGVSVTTAVENWNEANPDKAIDISYTEAETIVAMTHVNDGTIDFGIMDYAMFYAYTQEYDFDLVATEMDEASTKAISENDYAYYLFPFDEEELRDAINEVLIELQEDGTLTELALEFFGYDAAPEAEQYETTIN